MSRIGSRIEAAERRLRGLSVVPQRPDDMPGMVILAIRDHAGRLVDWLQISLEEALL